MVVLSELGLVIGLEDGSRLSNSSCREPELAVEDMLGSDEVLEVNTSSLLSALGVSAAAASVIVKAEAECADGDLAASPLHQPSRATYMSAPFRRGCFFLSVTLRALSPV